ncbi:MAG: hypothetical protein JXR77_15570 [Lentisphaeria bacterium]|nr:hypothetical protein [Lentisphaeria bacterium]
MREIGKRPWYRHPGRLAGGLVMGYFGLKLLGLVHLAVVGRVIPGHSGRLTGAELPEPGSPVIYFYQANGVTHSGWRRGIDYGAQELSVSYSPLFPRLHVTSVRPGIRSPWRFWLEPDYWLRLFLASLGIALGAFVVHAWLRFESRQWKLLHGLDREGPLG